ncbi:MAG: 5-dehydro-2-deoxygluconokinase [Pseudomonadota bacterium]
MGKKSLDAIYIGRAGVDLYGDQVGGRLEDMGSFSKYIGGSPANTSIGAARLGGRSALITRVGDDAMGRFIREDLAREGVETSAVITDPERLTGLVLLGIRDKAQFPLIFYREDCADMALTAEDVPEDLIANARAVVTSGTHFSTPSTKAMSLKALEFGEKNGCLRWIDLDFRPVLWGLADKGDGETRFVANPEVTQHLQSIMNALDVVVGTEEEIHIAGGSTDTIACLKMLRTLTQATFVVKLGPDGCAIFEGAIPERIEDGLVVPGFEVEVFNVLGAGDAFMGGLVTGYLEGRGWYEAARMANACGAFAVSRHACAPSYPSRAELDHLMEHGSRHVRLREDKALAQLHWSTTRPRDWPEVLAFAFDHRSQLEALGMNSAKISEFKGLCGDVLVDAQAKHPGASLGALCDARYGEDTLAALEGRGLWLARPIEAPGSRPLSFEAGGDLTGALKTVPKTQVIKCLCAMHPDDPADLMDAQIAQLRHLFDATRAERLELLLEIVPPSESGPDHGPDQDDVARAIEIVYRAEIFPDWWKLPAPPANAWAKTWSGWKQVIQKHDKNCRGILLLGLAAPLFEVCDAISRARKEPLCRGFAVGRTIFADAVEAWAKGAIDDAEAKARMAGLYDRLIAAWA